MKLPSFRLTLAVLTAGLCTGLPAQDKAGFAEISIAYPGGDTTVGKGQYIALVVEGTSLSFESSPIPADHVVAFVNELLTTRKVTYIGVYAREGTRFGEVVRALDILRGTNAKGIGLSISALPPGREP